MPPTSRLLPLSPPILRLEFRIAPTGSRATCHIDGARRSRVFDFLIARDYRFEQKERAPMHQLFSLVLVDWLLPNPEKDTPARWMVRIGLLIGVALIFASLR
jgi:hypothetical protein